MSEPFGGDESDEQTSARPGLKKIKGKSMFDGKPKPPSKEASEKIANEANDRLNSYRSRAMDLALKYRKILDDKTLPQNKTTLTTDIEAEILGALGQLAVDMNTDEDEVESMGSVGLNSLLLRCLLLQRDRVNSIDYENSVLEKKVKSLEFKLENILQVLDGKKTSE